MFIVQLGERLTISLRRAPRHILGVSRFHEVRFIPFGGCPQRLNGWRNRNVT